MSKKYQLTVVSGNERDSLRDRITRKRQYDHLLFLCCRAESTPRISPIVGAAHTLILALLGQVPDGVVKSLAEVQRVTDRPEIDLQDYVRALGGHLPTVPRTAAILTISSAAGLWEDFGQTKAADALRKELLNFGPNGGAEVQTADLLRLLHRVLLAQKAVMA